NKKAPAACTQPAPRTRGSFKSPRGSVRFRWNDVAEHTALRIRAFPDLVAMVARDHDDVAGAIGAANDADVAVVASALQHDDGADPRAVDALAIVEKRLRGAGIGG